MQIPNLFFPPQSLEYNITKNMDESPNHDQSEPSSLPMTNAHSPDGVVSDENQTSQSAGFLPDRDNPQAWKAGKKCKKPFGWNGSFHVTRMEQTEKQKKGRVLQLLSR